MKREKIIEKLKIDEHYYGDFGKQYLSNSDIKTLLSNPLALKEPSKTNAHFLVGGYFHTAILEPDKIKKYKIIYEPSAKVFHFHGVSHDHNFQRVNTISKILKNFKIIKYFNFQIKTLNSLPGIFIR